MSSFDQKSRQLSPELVERFKLALELGKWPDGQPVAEQQKDILMQAVILYENTHVDPRRHTAHIEDQCATATSDVAQAGMSVAPSSETTLKWNAPHENS